MFGNLGNLAGMLKQAKALQENMQKMQEQLVQQRYEADAGAGRCRQRHLNDRPRDGDGSDAQQVSHVEMEADTEHEENDPKFSEFADGAEVGIVARREGGNDHAGCKIANDR